MALNNWRNQLDTFLFPYMRAPSKLMTRSFFIFTFVAFYCLLTIYIFLNMHNGCPSAKEMAIEINRLVQQSPNHRYDLETDINDKVNGVIEPITEPYFLHDLLPVNKLLNRDFIPNTVFYVWCGERWFEFPHYLSVKSVIKILRPDTLIFFYEIYPIQDYWLYNTWIKELTEEYPFFRAHKLEAEDQSCLSNGDPNPDFITRIIARNGGTYVQNLTLMTNLPEDYQSYDMIDGLDLRGQGFMMAKRFAYIRHGNKFQVSPNIKKKRLECVHVRNYSMQNKKRVGSVYQTDILFPKDIWYLDNTFGRLARTVFYGSDKMKTPVSSTKTLVPNIAHVVWLGGGYMDFLFYLCLLSLLNVAKVEALYLHGDGPPKGEYWEMIKNHDRLHLIYRQHPGTIYGTKVNIWSHVTDIWRVDFMIKYGGIYVDTDVVFVKPLDDKIRSYDAVATYDWTYWNHPFPDTINFGVSIGKRNAKYWHLFQDSMRWFIDSDWAWNGLRRPYKVLERHPDKILIDPHFSVTCFRSLCHPTWWSDYHNESVHHANSDSIKDWRKDVYAFHWTLPTPFELINHTNLFKGSSSMFAEIGLHVLKESNMLEHFKKLTGN